MGSNELAVSSLDVQVRTDFDGNVSAVRIVNKVLERQDDFIACLVAHSRVIVVVDSDETNSKGRKNLLDILTGFDVVTTKTRKVFDHDTVDFSLLYKLNHPLKVGTVKVCTGETVITKLLGQNDLRVLLQEIFNQFSLVSDTVTFFLFP